MPGRSPGPGHFAGGRFIRNLGPSYASRDARLMYVSGESWLLVTFVELLFGGGFLFGLIFGPGRLACGPQPHARNMNAGGLEFRCRLLIPVAYPYRASTEAGGAGRAAFAMRRDMLESAMRVSRVDTTIIQ